MKDNNTVNMNGRNIKSFTQFDTVYIRRSLNGKVYMCLCKFIRYTGQKKLKVAGEIISISPKPTGIYQCQGQQVFSGIGHCALFDGVDYHWFQPNGFAK